VQTSLRSRISLELSGRMRHTTEISRDTSSLPCVFPQRVRKRRERGFDQNSGAPRPGAGRVCPRAGRPHGAQHEARGAARACAGRARGAPTSMLRRDDGVGVDCSRTAGYISTGEHGARDDTTAGENRGSLTGTGLSAAPAISNADDARQLLFQRLKGLVFLAFPLLLQRLCFFSRERDSREDSFAVGSRRPKRRDTRLSQCSSPR